MSSHGAVTLGTVFYYSIQLYTCDRSITVTAVLEYLESAFHLPGDESLFQIFIVLAL